MREFQEKNSWLLVLLLAVIIIINYIDRGVIAFAIAPIKQELGLNNADFGLVGSAFGLGYVLTALFSGWLVDLYGAKKILTAAVFLWSFAMVAMSLSFDFWSLFCFRLLLGIGEGPAFPSLAKFIFDRTSKEIRGKYLSYTLVAVPASIFISSPFITYFMGIFGFRQLFFLLGGCGFLWLIAFTALFMGFQSEIEGVKNKEKTPFSWSYLFSHPLLLANYIAVFSFGYTLFFALIWIPGYLQEMYGVDLKMLGWMVMLPWFLGALGVVLGGFLSDFLWKKTGSPYLSRSCLIALSLFLSGLCFLPLFLGYGLLFDLFWLSLAIGLAFVLNAPIYALHAEIVKPHVGTGQGIMTSSLALAGIISPSLTGVATEWSGNFHMALIIVSFLALFSALIVFFAALQFYKRNLSL